MDIQNVLVENAQDLPNFFVLLEKPSIAMEVRKGIANQAQNFHSLLKCLGYTTGELKKIRLAISRLVSSEVAVLEAPI